MRITLAAIMAIALFLACAASAGSQEITPLLGDWEGYGRAVAGQCSTILKSRMTTWDCKTHKAIAPTCSLTLVKRAGNTFLLDVLPLHSKDAADCGAFALVELDESGHRLMWHGCTSSVDRQNRIDGKDNFCSEVRFGRRALR